MRNSVLWLNAPNAIGTFDATLQVTNSNVQDVMGGEGNISANPLFINAAAGNYRLSPASPSIDAGNNGSVPLDIEADLDGNPRFVDDPATPDTGNGRAPIIDQGQPAPAPLCLGDLDSSGSVGVADLLALLAQWGACGGCDADLDGNGSVGVGDLLLLLSKWGPCPE